MSDTETQRPKDEAYEAVLSAVSPDIPQGRRRKFACAALAALNSPATKAALLEKLGRNALPPSASSTLDGLPKAFCSFVRPFLTATTG